eukprot:1465204-Ditylum_brightwellii.AAC.1
MDLDEGEVSPSSDTDPTNQRWVIEMTRAKLKTKGKDKQVVGFGFFTNNALSTTLRRSFLLSKDIMIASTLQIALMMTRLNMSKPTMMQDVGLTGTVALVSIKASTGLARQLRPS